LLGDGPAFDIDVVSGEGSYVCGEETALLNHLEHRRPEVRARPPYPAVHGLYGAPTLVNNVKTLATIPWILRHGGRGYAAMGHGTSRGTKVVSLNSLFRRPGLYEVEFGVPVRHIVEELGGGLAQGELRGVMIGGPLAGILPPQLLDTRFTFDDLRAVGCDVGHGGVIAFDERTSVVELVHHVFRFGADESCGKCTPCRVGTARIAALAGAIADGGTAPGPAGQWDETVAVLESESLCGHGTGLAAFARSAAKHYGQELAGCLA
jgi:formate dehydrogenase iron-sulfur subunit